MALNAVIYYMPSGPFFYEVLMLKVHFAPNSRAGRIIWLLEELELPYEVNNMAFHPKDLKSDEHREASFRKDTSFR